jgi:hypothetical protein
VPYYEEAVTEALNDVRNAAYDAAWQRSAYAGDLVQSAVVNSVDAVAIASLSSIETAVRALALTGATAIAQADEAARLLSEAYSTNAATVRQEVVAGLKDLVYQWANDAAEAVSEEVSEAYTARKASEDRALAAAVAVAAVVGKGRGALCNPSSRSTGLVQLGKPVTFGGFGAFRNFQFGPNQKTKVRRSQAQFVLTFDGEKIDFTYQPYIKSICVDETCDHAISSIKIRVLNENNRFGDDSVWREHKKIQLWTGYPTTGLQRRGNTFYSMGPKIVYPNNKGTIEILITGYGEEFRLGRTEKRRTWTNMVDSEIASSIASEYGWTADVEETTTLYEHVMQANESDWKFLDRRARIYGYQVYVEDGTLHFHSPRYRDSGVRLVYKDAQDSQLNGFTAWQEPLQFGKEVQADQIDPLSKEIFTVNSQEIDDEITQKTKSAYKYGTVISSTDISSLDGDQPRLFMFEEGHRQNSQNLQREAEGFSQFTRWLVQGEGSVVGLENLRVRDVIEVFGIGRDSGKYYIQELSSKILAGQFLTTFRVSRTWRGGTRGSRLGVKEVPLTQAAIVRVGA